MWSIYRITNKGNGRTYVGITKKSFFRRWGNHIKRPSSKEMSSDYNKFGATYFTWEVLEVNLVHDRALLLEKELIHAEIAKGIDVYNVHHKKTYVEEIVIPQQKALAVKEEKKREEAILKAHIRTGKQVTVVEERYMYVRKKGVEEVCTGRRRRRSTIIEKTHDRVKQETRVHHTEWIDTNTGLIYTLPTTREDNMWFEDDIKLNTLCAKVDRYIKWSKMTYLDYLEEYIGLEWKFMRLNDIQKFNNRKLKAMEWLFANPEYIF